MRYSLGLILAFAVIVAGCNKKTNVDLSSPKQAAKTLFQALYDNDTTKAKACVMSGAANETAVEIAARVSSSMRKASDAIFKKFGQTLKDPSGKPVNPNNINPKEIDDGTEEINGDTAKLILGASQKTLDLKRIDGQWKVDLRTMFHLPDDPALLAKARTMLDAMSQAADDVASDVEQDRYKTANEAIGDISVRMKAALEAEQQRLMRSIR